MYYFGILIKIYSLMIYCAVWFRSTYNKLYGIETDREKLYLNWIDLSFLIFSKDFIGLQTTPLSGNYYVEIPKSD